MSKSVVFRKSEIGLQFGDYLTCKNCWNKYTAWIVRRNAGTTAVVLECANCMCVVSLEHVNVVAQER